MKLLIITQTVDDRSDVLGFFTHWIKEFSKKVDSVTVIALSVGDFSFPDNVRVMSLGKESGTSRLKYLFRFLNYVIRERNNYEKVFVHMNQEYVLIGSLFWKMFGKQIFFWRNHAKGSFLTDIAVMFSKVVFVTSPDAYVKKFQKTIVMPVGVNVDLFKPLQTSPEGNTFLMFGRISPVKRVDFLVEALKLLKDRDINLKIDIVGNVSSKDADYFKKIKDKVSLYELGDVRFLPGVPYSEASKCYQQYRFFINLTPSGSLDKTIFEALSSGLITLVSNSFFKDKLPKEWVIEDSASINDLAEALFRVSKITSIEYQSVKPTISNLVQEHSLSNLVDRLVKIFL
jgi:glycosyltransferase involved in cell wall biosynthesis